MLNLHNILKAMYGVFARYSLLSDCSSCVAVSDLGTAERLGPVAVHVLGPAICSR